MTAEKREAAQQLTHSGLTVKTACALSGLNRASFYRQLKDWREVDSAVITAINDVLAKALRAGFWKCFKRLRRLGYGFNHKRVYRVYCRLGLNLPKRIKRKLPKREPKCNVSSLMPIYWNSLSQVLENAWQWRLDDNDERPHESLGYLPPREYRRKLENSSLEVSH